VARERKSEALGDDAVADTGSVEAWFVQLQLSHPSESGTFHSGEASGYWAKWKVAMITFEDSASLEILEMFGLGADIEGFVTRDCVKITDMNGEHLNICDFGGIKKSGEGFCLFSKSIVDLIKVGDGGESMTKLVFILVLLAGAVIISGCTTPAGYASCPTCEKYKYSTELVTVLDKMAVNNEDGTYNGNMFYILGDDGRIFRVDSGRHDIYLRMRIGETYKVQVVEGRITDVMIAPTPEPIYHCTTDPICAKNYTCIEKCCINGVCAQNAKAVLTHDTMR
jgi:hypothetical protein